MSQKLYTEQELRKAIILATTSNNIFTAPLTYIIDEVMKKLTPVKLPNDTEIENEVEQLYPVSKEYKRKYKNNYDDFNECWKEGAIWMRDKIQENNT